jgi:tetratricopeptide (TPR) repeat protein
MNQPSVFISCVSPEFRQVRSRVAVILTRLGYTPIIQEIFGTEPGDLRQVLRDKIDACEGLIQIVGQGYGAEPPTVDAVYGRVSYTQFEFLYARSQKKKTWLIFAGDACTRDTPLERLDLPRDPAHPDPTSYQDERRALQLAYRSERQKDGHLRHTATSDTDLELKVERLRDELGELRRAFKLWQNKVLRAFALCFVLLALIGGSVWWFGYSQHSEIKEISEEARHITKDKIRAQLLESVEHTRQAALADAEKAKAWQERERLRKAAEKTYAESISRIDELAASFSEIEGTAKSSQVFDEMTRILAEQGVDQALAYVATQQPSILERVKGRAAAASEKNRVDLLPLLKSAQLLADRNNPAEADSLFGAILALEPDWPEARNAFAGYLTQQGEVIEPAKGNLMLKKAVEICQGTLALSQRGKSPQSWATAQDYLGLAFKELGMRSDPKEGRKLLKDAVVASRSALEIYTRADLPQDWAKTQNHLGLALYELGIRSGAEEGRKLLQDALTAFRSALEIRTKANQPQDWAKTQNNIGIALYELGIRSGAEDELKLLRDALIAYRSGLEIDTKAGQPREWSAIQSNLGNTLYALGTRNVGEDGSKLLQDAVAADRSALEIYTRADLPQDWARSHYNLGIVLYALGTRNVGEDGLKPLQDAVASFHSALEIYTKADLPQEWVRTQYSLGTALYALGTRNVGEDARNLLQDALAAFRSALEIYTNADLPQECALTRNKLGNALSALGNQLKGEEGLKRKREAVELFQEVTSYKRDELSRYRLASALGDLAFHLVLNSQFAEAQTQCEEAQSLADGIGDGVEKTDRDSLIFIQQNLAHALLFQGHYDEALAIYREYWDKPQNGKTFGEVTLKDFAEFEKAGLTHPDLSRMKQALGDLPGR